MTAAVGVVIIDESEALDPSLRAALEHEPALYTVGDTGSAPAVALVVLPDRGFTPTLERLAALKRARADVKVLLAFQSLDSATLSSLLAAGADAVVARQSTPREVCAALLGLMQPAPQFTADGRGGTDGLDGFDGAEGLTPREAEILRFLSAGFSNKEVARRLSLSVRTVETHRLNLRRKTQTGRLKDLVALARKLGLKPVVDAETRRGGTDGSVSVSRSTMNAAAPW